MKDEKSNSKSNQKSKGKPNAKSNLKADEKSKGKANAKSNLKADEKANEKTSENSNEKTTLNSNPEVEVKEPKKERKFLKFLWRYKFYVILILIIIIGFIWGYIKINVMKNNFDKQTKEIVEKYEVQIDSINSNRLLLTAQTFSWAIRSELLRDNKEQINQFFDEFIKNNDIIKLQLINPQTSIVELSTNKKDVGTVFSNYNNIEEQTIRHQSGSFLIITPIFGLDKKLNIFVMEIKNIEHK